MISARSTGFIGMVKRAAAMIFMATLYLLGQPAVFGMSIQWNNGIHVTWEYSDVIEHYHLHITSPWDENIMEINKSDGSDYDVAPDLLPDTQYTIALNKVEYMWDPERWTYQEWETDNLGSDLVSYPSTPINLKVAVLSCTQTSLTWENTSSITENITIERAEGFGDGLSFQTVSPQLSPQTTTYLDSSATTATRYTYRVCAHAGKGDPASDPDAIATVMPPTDVTVAPVSDQTLRVSWKAAPGAPGYKVYRLHEPSWTPVPVSDFLTTLTLDDGPGLDPVSHHVYWVKACVGPNPEDESVFSPKAEGDTLPRAPVLSTIQTLSNNSLKLTWGTAIGATEGYEIYRNSEPGTSATFTMVGFSREPAFEDSLGLKEATHYWYKVCSRGFSGRSLYSSIVSGWTAPTPPSNFSVIPETAAPQTTMLLRWTDNSANEDGFTVERSSSGGAQWDAIKIGKSPGVGLIVTWRDPTASTEGKQYWYRVRARLDKTNWP